MATETAAPPTIRLAVEQQPDRDAVARLSGELRIPAALAGLLVQRGFGSPDAARKFLRPSLDDLADPYALAGMREAVDAVVGAVRSGTRIMVHGDYDVDGQCAAAVLTRALRQAGADVVPFLPHRLRDGYDFAAAGLAAAREAGVGLIVTCDCGITAVETVAAAHAAGIGVVITDHHLPGPELPAARAIVDPQLQPESPLAVLCGTGIAFKLVQALVPALGLPANFHFHLLDLVALATVADVVPLVGENRILVKHGLRLLARTRWTGVRALIESAGLAGRDIRAGQVGFILGPRLNAAGRVGDANDGLRLLLSDDAVEAAALARDLERMNAERQTLDQRMLEEALAQVDTYADPAEHPVLVLTGDGWHPGVVGIVASRVVERYGRPTFLVAFDGDTGKGSGRSISCYDLHGALVSCGDLLDRFGGHHMAAGVTLQRAQLEEFRRRFVAHARGMLAPEAIGPEQRVDILVSLSDVTDELEQLCRHLEPCGMKNPAPVFGVRGVRFADAARVGNGHLRGMLTDGASRLCAIGFGWADRVPWLGSGPVDAAFRLERNEYRGETTLQARLLALLPHA